MHDRHQSPTQRATAPSFRSCAKPKETIWIRGRRYTLLEELGFRHRPRWLVFDGASRCRRLLMRLPNNDITNQHLRVLRRLPQTAAVPQIIDTQIRGEEHLVVLSWLDGLDLKQYLDQVERGRVVAPSAYESLRLLRGLAHGLLQLHHHAQLIHGDLKPQNLVLTRKPAWLAMIDFGSAWRVERAAFRDSGDGSEPLYTAPELLDGSGIGDFRSDQFSASVILYQLLTGQLPFAGLGGQAGLKRFRKDFENAPPAPSQHSQAMQRLPRPQRQALDQLLISGLQFDPDLRYPTPSAWLDAIESLFLKLKLRQHGSSDSGDWHRLLDWLAGWIPLPSEERKEPA